MLRYAIFASKVRWLLADASGEVASWRELRRTLRRLPMTNHGRARLARRKEGMSIVAGPPDRPVMVGNVRQVGP